MYAPATTLASRHLPRPATTTAANYIEAPEQSAQAISAQAYTSQGAEDLPRANQANGNQIAAKLAELAPNSHPRHLPPVYPPSRTTDTTTLITTKQGPSALYTDSTGSAPVATVPGTDATTVLTNTRQRVSPPNVSQDSQGTQQVISEDADQTQPAMQSAYLALVASPLLPHQADSPDPCAAWTHGRLTTQKLEAIAAAKLPTSVQVQLAQTFGKDSLSQSFFSQKCFCHVLLPVLKSGYLSCRASYKT